MKRIYTAFLGLVALAMSVIVLPGLLLAAYLALVWAGAVSFSIFTFLLVALASAIVPIACLLAKWDDVPSRGTYDTYDVIRGDVPKPLRFLQTNDERLPGGLHEPTVMDVYIKHGNLLTSIYWLGLRNRAHGVRKILGSPSTEESYALRFQKEEGKKYIYGERPDGSWYFEKEFLGLKLVIGHRIYKLPGNEYLASPTFTIKFAK